MKNEKLFEPGTILIIVAVLGMILALLAGWAVLS